MFMLSLILVVCLVASTAAVLAYRALVHDWLQHRGRSRRCPKCGHTLAEGTSLSCTECGFTARNERHAHRPRRRWRLAAVAALLALIAVHLFGRAEAIQRHGLVAAIPDSALVLIAPSAVREPWPPWRAALADELLRRVDDEPPAGWQLRLWAVRIVRRAEESGTFDIIASRWLRTIDASDGLGPALRARADAMTRVDWSELRPRWPLGADVVGRPSLQTWRRYPMEWSIINAKTGDVLTTGISEHNTRRWTYGLDLWRDGMSLLLEDAQPDAEVVARLRVTIPATDTRAREIFHAADAPIPIHVEGTLDDVMTTMCHPALDAFIANLTPTLRFAGRPYLDLGIEMPNAALDDLDLDLDILAFRLEVMDGDRVCARAFTWDSWHPGVHTDTSVPGASTAALIPLTPVPGTRLSPSPSDAQGLTLRIVGDPWIALRCPRGSTCWGGDVTVPLTWSEANAP